MPPPLAIIVCLFVFGIPLLIFSIPLLLIWTNHKRKMEEMRLQRQSQVSGNVAAEFAAIRAEIQSLRDTTMQYDLSFDTALQQMERRMTQLERQSGVQVFRYSGVQEKPGTTLGKDVQHNIEGGP